VQPSPEATYPSSLRALQPGIYGSSIIGQPTTSPYKTGHPLPSHLLPTPLRWMKSSPPSAAGPTPQCRPQRNKGILSYPYLSYGVTLHIVSSPIRKFSFGEPITRRSVSRPQRNFTFIHATLATGANLPLTLPKKNSMALGHPSARGATDGKNKSSSNLQMAPRIRSRNPDTTTTQHLDHYSYPEEDQDV